MATLNTSTYGSATVRQSSVGRFTTLSVLALTSVLGGCSERNSASAAESTRPAAVQSASSDESMPEVLASIGDEKITLTEIRARVGDDLDQLETRYRRSRHNLIERTLEDLLRDRVLLEEAKKQGKTIEQLIAVEAGGTVEPSDFEITAWYNENQARTGGRALETIRPQIADFLRKQKRATAAKRLEGRMNQDRKVVINLEPYRLPIGDDKAPSKGPANAPVTLVEFSDFQCPFCSRFFPTLKQLEQKYGDKLRIVYRQYPIPSLHPNAFKAAEASLCANDQGKFWELHDLMFQEQNQLSVSELKVKAGRIGMDQKKFDSCLDSGRYVEQVQRDIKDAQKVGITGTPALFVNGVEVEGGAVSLDVVSAEIDKELARHKR